MRKTFAVVFIFLGVMVILYPKITQLNNTYMQNQLLHQWDHKAAAKSTLPEDSYKKLDQIFSNSSKNAQPLSDSVNKSESEQMVGVIEVKKIGLRLPILEGASLDHLSIAAGHLEGTVFPGEKGNSAIAAHRSRTYGKMFNRLNELKIGDEIRITDQKETYLYKVYETMIVNPNDLSVLKGNGKDQILTLITCDPITTGTHRLIVHAKIQ